jgi:serine protease AprX
VNYRCLIQHLKRHAVETQTRVRAQLTGMNGVEVTRSFWLANALVVTVDLDAVSLERVTELEHVKRVHSPELPENRPRPDSSVSSQSDGNVFEERDVSWAVELVNAPAVWDQYDARGESARICIIDTGVDPDHPDIDLDGWAEFDRQGQRVESEPNEPSPDEAPMPGHGTGMSSVATGGDASGHGHAGGAVELRQQDGVHEPGPGPRTGRPDRVARGQTVDADRRGRLRSDDSNPG